MPKDIVKDDELEPIEKLDKPKKTRRKVEEKRSLKGAGFAVITLVILSIFAVSLMQAPKKSRVAGANIERVTPAYNPGEKVRENVEDKLDEIKDNVENLEPGEVVASSPQVEKIIQDLQGLQQLPQKQIKAICENFCKNL